MQTELSRQNTSRSYISLSHSAQPHLSPGVLSFPRVSGAGREHTFHFLSSPWHSSWAQVGGAQQAAAAIPVLWTSCASNTSKATPSPLRGLYLDSLHTTASFLPALSASLRPKGFLLPGRREQGYQGPHVLNALGCRTTYKNI